MTEQTATKLLSRAKNKIQALRKNVQRPARYPESLKQDVVALLDHYSKAELSTELNLASSIVSRFCRESLKRPDTQKESINFFELPTQFVKDNSSGPKIKIELTLNNVQIRIFE